EVLQERGVPAARVELGQLGGLGRVGDGDPRAAQGMGGPGERQPGERERALQDLDGKVSVVLRHPRCYAGMTPAQGNVVVRLRQNPNSSDKTRAPEGSIVGVPPEP